MIVIIIIVRVRLRCSYNILSMISSIANATLFTTILYVLYSVMMIHLFVRRLGRVRVCLVGGGIVRFRR